MRVIRGTIVTVSPLPCHRHGTPSALGWNRREASGRPQPHDRSGPVRKSRPTPPPPLRRLDPMPKTLTGAELQLDDAPARASELFLVDGNNLAYRAFFALPEELATSEGFSTNALLGFTNMLFKLLADYRPKGVAVAWDTRPVHRT